VTKQMNGQHDYEQMPRLTKKNLCIVEITYKHFQGGHGRLQLGDVYTCHGLHSTLLVLLLLLLCS